MSGMEPMAALGLACNIMQLLSFGGEAISMCRKVYKTGEIDPILKDYSSQAAEICESLNNNLTQRQLDLDPDALALQQRAIMCKAAADKLNDELKLLTPTSEASWWKRGFTAPIKAMRHKDHLAELEKDLNNLKSGLDTQLLVRIFSLVDPAKLNTKTLAESEGLLATTLQQVASGQQDLSRQILTTLESAQDRFISEYSRNQRIIEQHMAATTLELQNERTRVKQEKSEEEKRMVWNQLLKSLHFDMRMDRANRIEKQYSDTCHWIFESPTKYGLAASHKPQQAHPESHQRSWPCFTTWLQSEGPLIYWICGKAGSGKSTLMKFVASDESPTRDSLEQWQPNVRILSHYFWLAGSPMQNNIKGLLCSLVHQVLSQDMLSALALLESKPGIAFKSSTMDWDPAELRRILLNLTHQPGKAFCIFIDGLDELSPEESPLDLIDILNELQNPQVKMCLASRPEPAMKMYLGHYPTLPMHAFIRDDIRKYAEGILRRAMSHMETPFDVDPLVAQVLSEADGVFLWVVLVSRSLELGNAEGNSLQVLEERLRQMPKSLSDLYSSMWQRRQDGPETYQKGFSQFMNLMLAAGDLTCLLSSEQVSVFELMAATNPSFLDRQLNQDSHVSKEELESLCRETRDSIESWSAGLLAITSSAVEDWSNGAYRNLAFYAKMTVGYIHRTARDFLLDEVEGQKLWQRVDVSREELTASLVKAALVRCQLWEFGPIPRRIEGFLGSIDRSGEAAYVPKSTLPDIEKAFYKGYLGVSGNREFNAPGGVEIKFLLAAADYGFHDYVVRRTQEMQQTGQLKPQDCASLLYGHCSRSPGYCPLGDHFAAREKAIQSLLLSDLSSFANTRFAPDFSLSSNLSSNLLLAYLVSNLEDYCSRPIAEESITTLKILWQQVPSVQNVHIKLTVWISNALEDGHDRVRWGFRDKTRLHSGDEALVVITANAPYLITIFGILVHPTLCVPEILSKQEEPSAQAILIGNNEGTEGLPDYYAIERKEDSAKIMECITPLPQCRHGLDRRIMEDMAMTEKRKLRKVLREIATKTKPLDYDGGRGGDRNMTSKRGNAVMDEFLTNKFTRLSPPSWW